MVFTQHISITIKHAFKSDDTTFSVNIDLYIYTKTGQIYVTSVFCKTNDNDS